MFKTIFEFLKSLWVKFKNFNLDMLKLIKEGLDEAFK